MKPKVRTDAANTNARPTEKMIEAAKNAIDLKSWRKPTARRALNPFMSSTDVLMTGGYAA